ncbi:PHP domain-containing protein [Halieaceae bacterium IMCC14734]|uniref:PHP domain-containing protein n=2 Tax=Candidatus Litorirhabdus singularis TaxID=2518993 RepID=A0ABT3TME0_9GAMM|nr:PHP domain-containing protein [Candidatus Litorirhabdus singularis]
MYAELHCLSNFSFQRGASHPRDLVQRAAELGYTALAITDECSLAGVVKAHVAAQEYGIKLIIGSELNLEEGIKLLALAPNRAAYSELSGLISMARRRSPKGEYRVSLRDVIFHLKRCLLIWLPVDNSDTSRAYGQQLRRLCKERLWLGVSHLRHGNETQRYLQFLELATSLDIPMLACGNVQMHHPRCKPLHDVITAIAHNTSVDQLGRLRHSNSQQHLRPIDKLCKLYPAALLQIHRTPMSFSSYSLIR